MNKELFCGLVYRSLLKCATYLLYLFSLSPWITIFWLIPWFIQISGSGCWILISNLKYLRIPLLSYGPPERLPTSAFAAGFKVAPLPWAMDLSSGTDRYEVVTWTGELPTFLDWLAPARKLLPYGRDWAPWIPFPFRISLTYGTLKRK